MGVFDSISIYSEELQYAFIFSAIIFLFYGLINLMEMNKILRRDMKIDRADHMSTKSLVFAYFFSYVQFMLKNLIAMFIIFTVITVVRLTFRFALQFLESEGEGVEKEYFKYEEVIASGIFWILGYFFTIEFLIVYIILFPTFIVIYVAITSIYFRKKEILKDERKTSVMVTMHNQKMLLISISFIISFVFSVVLYYVQLEKNNFNPGLMAQMVNEITQEAGV